MYLLKSIIHFFIHCLYCCNFFVICKLWLVFEALFLDICFFILIRYSPILDNYFLFFKKLFFYFNSNYSFYFFHQINHNYYNEFYNLSYLNHSRLLTKFWILWIFYIKLRFFKEEKCLKLKFFFLNVFEVKICENCTYVQILIKLWNLKNV